MAVTLDHTEGNALSWSDATPAKGITALAIIDAGANSYYDYVNIVLAITMDANIDGAGVDIQVLHSADSGTTVPDTNITIFNCPAAELTRIYAIQLQRFNYVKIGVLNDTTTEGEVTPVGKWEGCKVTDQ